MWQRVKYVLCRPPILKISSVQRRKNPLSGCTRESNNCFASLQEAEEHSVSADTHDLNNCRAWSQAVLSKEKNRDTPCSSRHCVAQERALLRSTATKNKALGECSQDSNNCSASSQEAQSKLKKKAQAITVSAEKQREHNVQTHRLRAVDNCRCSKKTNKCSEKESI